MEVNQNKLKNLPSKLHKLEKKVKKPSSLISLTGQLVKTSSAKHINVSDLTSGIYLIIIEDVARKITIRKRLFIE